MEYPTLDWAKTQIRTIRLLSETESESLVCSYVVVSLDDSDFSKVISDNDQSTDPSVEEWRLLWDQASEELNRDELEALDESAHSSPPHQYVALSYQWGQESELAIVDGHSLQIPKNLGNALRKFRTKKAITQGMLIWADSICINQSDKSELQHQIPMMRDIYRGASDVVIWLGEDEDGDDERSGLAVDLLYALADAERKKALGEFMAAYGRSADGEKSRSWLALHDFMNKSYWTRLWVIQELCMGKASSPILCGHRAIPWGVFYRALWHAIYDHLDAVIACLNREHLLFRGTEFVEGHSDLLRRSFVYHVNLEQIVQSGSKVGLSRRNSENAKNGWHIMPMLDRGRLSNATLDHDRVYGLLAILPKCVTELLVPDYTQSVDQCFTSLTKAWIEGRGDLEILSQCTLTTHSPDLPTWVADWRNKQHLRLFSGANVPYRASGDAKVEYSFAKNDTVLTVTGVLFDHIDGLGHQSITAQDCIEGVIQARSDKNPYGGHDQMSEALWRTLVGDITTSGHPAKKEDGNILKISADGRTASSATLDSKSEVRLRQHEEILTKNASLLLAGSELKSYLKSSVAHTDAAVDAVPTAALEQAYRYSRLKRLGITRGGYLCMVPDEARPDDVICVLLGSDVPLLLRAGRNDMHAIVGACYVHGIMRGEALDPNSNAFRTSRKFHLT